MTPNKFVVITGIDGAGKDFVAQGLCHADPGSHLIATPTPPFCTFKIRAGCPR